MLYRTPVHFDHHEVKHDYHHRNHNDIIDADADTDNSNNHIINLDQYLHLHQICVEGKDHRPCCCTKGSEAGRCPAGISSTRAQC